jgi:hypothetical protein
MLLAILLIGCASPTPKYTSPTPMPKYISEMVPLAEQYNLARDMVEEAVEADANPPETLEEAVQIASQLSSRLETAIQSMNEAYKALGNLDVQKKFRVHQQTTLSAWRAGIEASVVAKVYFDEIASMKMPGASLILDMNKLFREEDRYQLEARRALEDAR